MPASSCDGFARVGCNAWLGALIGAEPPAHRRCANRAIRLLPVYRSQRILAREQKLKVREVIVAPEQLIAHHHRRYAEYTLAYGLVRLRAQVALYFRRLSLRNERRARQTDLGSDGLPPQSHR
jgi:hypothetical protein